MATKRTGKKTSKKAIRKVKKPPLIGDSPIIIGGGGGGKKLRRYVWIEFDHNFYTPNPGDLKEHWNKDERLLRLYINGDLKDIGNSNRVEVECYRPRVGYSTMRIKRNQFGIKFEPGEFPYDVAQQVHFGDNWTVMEVRANAIANPLYKYDPQQGTSDCDIDFHNAITKRRARVKRRAASKRGGAAKR